MGYTRQVAEATSKTFLIALATGLLARATSAETDALVLKATADAPGAYGARSLAHDVLVPFIRAKGVDLRVRGREPLNNQPFFRYDRIDKMDRVHPRARADHAYLVQTLRRANELAPQEAELALAALFRIRLEVAVVVPQLPSGLAFEELVRATLTFLKEDAENGKRAQALTASLLDLAFGHVTTGRVNDPSRKVAGDCHVWIGEAVILSAEVRAKPIMPGEALEFARRLALSKISRGLVVALANDPTTLDIEGERKAALSEYGILLEIRTDMSQLMRDAFWWLPSTFRDAADKFPAAAYTRLVELEVGDDSLSRWVDLCRPGIPHD